MDKPSIVKASPPGWRPAPIECIHDYEFLRSEFVSSDGSYREHYEQKDVFFCRKCLKYEVKLVHSETSRGRPSWFKG